MEIFPDYGLFARKGNLIKKATKRLSDS